MRNMKHKDITRLKNYKPTTPSLRSRVIPDLSYLDHLLPEKTLKVPTKKPIWKELYWNYYM